MQGLQLAYVCFSFAVANTGHSAVGPITAIRHHCIN